ncbi:MAG TPA: FHA domain-containing protein [Polyangiaceae bacterium]
MTSTPIPVGPPRVVLSSTPQPPSPREAYTLARALDAARPPQTAPGHRFYWLTANSFGSCDLPAGRGAAPVVGSHPLCDVRLATDNSVELRHLLVRSSLLDDGAPLLSIQDLHTMHGFYLSNGAVQRSIDATGAVVVRVGSHALVALPSGTRLKDELPTPTMEAADESPYRAASFSPELMKKPLGPHSHITLLPKVVDFAQTKPSPVFGEATYELTMTASVGQRSLRVSESDMKKGVLVGRSLNCDPLLRAIVDMGTSRGHLLFTKDKDGVFAHDLASTQGTWFFGQRSRVIELADSGTVMRIGAVTPITIAWRRL